MGDRRQPSPPPSDRPASDPVSRQVKPDPPPAPPLKQTVFKTVPHYPLYDPPGPDEPAFLIVCSQGYYWRERARGYTSNVAEAGVFTQQAADAVTAPSNATRRDRVIPLTEKVAELEALRDAAQRLLDAERVSRGWRS